MIFSFLQSFRVNQLLNRYFPYTFLFFVLFLLNFSKLHAQVSTDNFPVTARVYFLAPYSQRLSDYFSSDKRLQVDLLLKDLTKSSIEVYLKWSLEGAGVIIKSSEGYIPPRYINLQRGIHRRLSGLDLRADYFVPNAIEGQGIEPTAIYNANLPEGFYTMRVQAIETSTGQVVSNTSETFMVLAYPQPPFLNLPYNGTELPVSAMQKTVFQWTPRHFATPNTNVVYRFRVCEVPADNEPNEQVMLSCTEPRIDVTVATTTHIGDLSNLIKPFEVGKRYAMQVTVSDLSGELLNFGNGGKSEVSWFRYGQACMPPAGVSINSLGSDRVQIVWQAAVQAQGYVVEYRSGSGAWQQQRAYGTTAVVTDIDPKADYEFRVRTDCGAATLTAAVLSEPSEVITWNISSEATLPTILPIPLTDPWHLPVQTSNTGLPVTPQGIKDLYSNYPAPPPNPFPSRLGESNLPPVGVLKIPDCALQSSVFGCSPTQPTVPLPTGQELTALKVGDVLGIYDFAVFVAPPAPIRGANDGWSGRGLVKLPFLEGSMALVEFRGLKAKKGNEGTDGGCVYELADGGYCRVIEGNSEGVFAAKSQLLQSVLLPANSSGKAFIGTLSQAVAAYDSLGLLAEAGIKLSQSGVPVAVRQGIGAIASAFDSLVASSGSFSSNPRAVLLRQEFTRLQAQLAAAAQDPTQLPQLLPLKARLDGLLVILKDLTTPPPPTQTETGGANTTTTTTPTPPAIPTIAAPQNVSYKVLGNNSVQISWAKNPQHLSYKLVYKDKTGEERTLYATTNTLTITGLEMDGQYPFTLTAYGGINTSTTSEYSQSIKLGTVCVASIDATASRIMEGDKLTLSVTSCVDGNGQPGVVLWKENEQAIGVFTSRVFAPTATTTYTATCTLSDSYGQPQSCKDTKTIIVDKKCTGVVATATPSYVTQDEPVILKATGCAGNIVWRESYPFGKEIGKLQNQIAYPLPPSQTYALSCIDQIGNTCTTTTGKVNVNCGLKLAVESRSSYQKEEKRVYVTGVGCPDKIEWSKEGGNDNIDIYEEKENSIVYKNIRKGFIVNAICKSTGCIATTGLVPVPPGSHFFLETYPNDGDCTELGKIQILRKELGNALGITLSVLIDDDDKRFTWDDIGTNENPRKINPIPKISQVYSVTKPSGCKGSYIFKPIASSTDGNITTAALTVPCVLLKITAPISVEIPYDQNSKSFTVTMSGCTSPDPGIVTWRWIDPTGIVVNSGTGTTANIRVNDADKDKVFTIEAACKIQGRTVDEIEKELVKITKANKPLVPVCEGYEANGKIIYRDPCGAFFELGTQENNNFVRKTDKNNYIYKIGQTVYFKVYNITDFTRINEIAEVWWNKDSNKGSATSFTDGSIKLIEKNEGDCTATFSFSPKANATKTYWYSEILIHNFGGDPYKECTKYIYLEFTSDGFPPPTIVYTPVNSNSSNLCDQYQITGVNHSKFTISYFELEVFTSKGYARTFTGKYKNEPLGIIPLEYDGGTPKKFALIDKVCKANSGTVSWTLNGQSLPKFNTMADELGNEINYPHAVAPNTRVYTSTDDIIFKGICTVGSKSCVTEIVVKTTTASNRRIGVSTETTDGSTATETTDNTGDYAPCVYSNKLATQILLESILCNVMSDISKGNEKATLESVKATLEAAGVQLATITDAMVANLAAGKCSDVVNALIKDIQGVQRVGLLNYFNETISTKLISDAIESGNDTELINTDFKQRTIIGPPIDLPALPFGRVGATSCPAYYFSPVEKRIYIPNISKCSYSQNGVMMQFTADDKEYIPLWLRSSGAFMGYFDKGTFSIFATPTNEPNVKVILLSKLLNAKLDVEKPYEATGIERWRAFMNENQQAQTIVDVYGNPLSKAEFDIRYAAINENLREYATPSLFDVVERFKIPYGPYLFNLTELSLETERIAYNTEQYKNDISEILDNGNFECKGVSKTDARICKLFNCVYDQIKNPAERDILNAKLDIATRKRLITLLAQDGLYVFGRVAGDCAIGQDGIGPLISLIRTTPVRTEPQNDILLVLEHLQSDLNGKPLLETLIEKFDFGALVSAITYIEKSSAAATALYDKIENTAPSIEKHLIVLNKGGLFAGNYVGKVVYDFDYENNKVRVTKKTIIGFVDSPPAPRQPVYSTPISYDLDPYEYVVVVNHSKLSAIEGDLGLADGEVAQLPAIALAYMSQKQANATLLEAINLATIPVGVGAGVNAFRAARYGVALFEAAAIIGATAQTILDADEILPVQARGNFAKMVDNYNLVIGLGGLGIAGVQGVGAWVKRAGNLDAYNIKRSLAQSFLDDYNSLRNGKYWSQVKGVGQQRLTELAEYLIARGMRAGDVVRDGIATARSLADLVRQQAKVATISGFFYVATTFGGGVLTKGIDFAQAGRPAIEIGLNTVNKIDNVAFEASRLDDIGTTTSRLNAVSGQKTLTQQSLESVNIKTAGSAADVQNPANWQAARNQQAVNIARAETNQLDLMEIQIGASNTALFLLLARPKNDNANDCSICKGEVVNGQARKDVCKTLEALLAKAGGTSAYKSIIEYKLCKSTLTNLALAEIATQLTAYNQIEVQLYLNDLNGTNNVATAPDNRQGLSSNIGRLSGDLVRAWKFIYNETKGSKRLDMNLEEVVKSYTKNNELVTYFTRNGEDMFKKFIKTYGGGCNTCEPPTVNSYPAQNNFPLTHKYASELINFANSYHQKPNYKEVIAEITQTVQKQDGGLFLLRYLKSIGESSVTDFEGDINLGDVDEEFECDNCRYDARINLSGQGEVKVDFKSYKIGSLETSISKAISSPTAKNSFYKQFKAYLQNATDQPFVYIFNGQKANLTDIKKQFQRLFADPTQAKVLYEIRKEFFDGKIWANKTIDRWEVLNDLSKENSDFWESSVFSFIITY